MQIAIAAWAILSLRLVCFSSLRLLLRILILLFPPLAPCPQLPCYPYPTLSRLLRSLALPGRYDEAHNAYAAAVNINPNEPGQLRDPPSRMSYTLLMSHDHASGYLNNVGNLLVRCLPPTDSLIWS
eukprot:722734-Rhodomonas_salina.2